MELTNQQRNVVIIGGGPAGIEASKALDALGYTVFLSRERTVWADIWAAGTVSFHTELRQMMSWDR